MVCENPPKSVVGQKLGGGGTAPPAPPPRNYPLLLTSFQEGLHHKLFFQGFFFQNSASNMANYIIVDIVNYLMLILEKLLATRF